MTVATDKALDDLRYIKNIYKESSLTYDRINALCDTLAKLTTDDADAVPALANAYVSNYETPAFDFSSVLIAVLSEFSTLTRSEESTVARLIVDLDTYMRSQSPRIKIKDRGTIIDAAVDGGSNSGTQTLVINTKEADGTVIESANVDNIVYTLQSRAQSLSQLGVDSWNINGTARSDVSEWDGPGAGALNGSMSSMGAGRSGFFRNASFDQSFLTGGAGANKIPGITITAGDAGIAIDRTEFAENRGGNPASLLITTTCTMEIDFVALGIALSEIRPFIMGLRTKSTGNATIVMTLGSAGAATPYTGTITLVGATAWQNKIIDPDTETAWRETYDETGRPILTIEVTAISGTLNLDDLIFDTLPVIAGVPSAIISGLTSPGDADTHTSNRVLNVGAGSSELVGMAALDFVDQISVNGVALLRESEPFDTDLATSAANVATKINSIPTAPDYEASALLGVISIKQRKPTGEILTVLTTITNGSGGFSKVDTDVSGGNVGEIADMCARHVGFVPSHDSAATNSATQGDWRD